MYMIQISQEKKEKLTECTEKLLHIAGKLMQCLESLDEGSEYGERNPDWERQSYPESEMGERSSRMGMRTRSGRYSRF